MTEVQVLVLAKEPVAGRVKTRLTPDVTAEQAAELAGAALEDTLNAVRGAAVRARVLVTDGLLTADGFSLQPQTGGPLDVRLAAAFCDAWGRLPVPMLLVGMDTPQITASLVDQAIRALLAPGVDAVLGLAEDGGWWALGLRAPHPELILGIETSRHDTGARQYQALVDSGLTVDHLPVLRDVDTFPDLAVVASQSPGSAFARVLASVLA